MTTVTVLISMKNLFLSLSSVVCYVKLLNHQCVYFIPVVPGCIKKFIVFIWNNDVDFKNSVSAKTCVQYRIKCCL